MTTVALVLSLAWAGFWVYFGLASGLGERLSPSSVLLHAALPGLVFLASAPVAWRWEPLGGALLLVEGMFVLVAYPFIAYRHFSASTILFVLVAMALPPLMAGFLYLMYGGSRGGAPVAGGA